MLAVGTRGLSHEGAGHVSDSDMLVVGVKVLLVSM